MILKEIRDSRSALEPQLSTISVDINLLKDDHRKFAYKVKITEQTVETIVPQVNNHDEELSQMRQQIESLQARADDAEGRARLNNLEIVGFPEGSRGPNPTTFIEN